MRDAELSADVGLADGAGGEHLGCSHPPFLHRLEVATGTNSFRFGEAMLARAWGSGHEPFSRGRPVASILGSTPRAELGRSATFRTVKIPRSAPSVRLASLCCWRSLKVAFCDHAFSRSAIIESRGGMSPGPAMRQVSGDPLPVSLWALSRRWRAPGVRASAMTVL